MKTIFNPLKVNMSLRESIEYDYKTALTAKDKNKITTKKTILSGITALDINTKYGTDKKATHNDDIKKLLNKMIKHRS